MGRFEGRQALVTGGARGIGAAIARELAAGGASVLVADVLDDEGTALAAEIEDITDEANWREALELVHRGGELDVLVNNAGILDFGLIDQQEPKAFRHVIDVNLFGPWLGMHVMGPSLRRAHGVIVNISSTAGLMGYSNLGGYVASKWGLRGLTKSAALDFAADGVRVCSVHPGPIHTPMTAGLGDAVVSAQPMARFGEPEEVARMVAFIGRGDLQHRVRVRRRRRRHDGVRGGGRRALK